jgi:DNA-binding response OmpR family regulator
MTPAFHTLIVEDDPDIARLVALQVDSLQGSHHHVSQLGQAQAYCEQHPIHLLILDLSLPDGDGLAFCRRFRERDETTPILMLTARSDEVDRVLGLELGADDYLSKPFGLAELKARIKALIRRASHIHAQPSPTTVSLGQLNIDPKKHQAWLFQKELHLTAKEFELLHFLARHPGEVFSRLDLLEQVWGIEHDGYEHTVNSHLNRLRNKVEADPANPRLLETVWGVGYKLNADALQATSSEAENT